MKKLPETHVKFDGEECSLSVRFSNRGEPYRDGIELELEEESRLVACLFIESREAKQLRDLLNRLYPNP